jgi:hypothetical protein
MASFPELPAGNQVDPFSEDGWRYCSPKSLRGHIANAHFQARTLADIGVPLYDIEIAEVRGIGLGWVVKRAFEKITREENDIQAEIDDHRVADKLEVSDYRLRLVKSIRTIADKGLADVPWDKIDEVYPDASHVAVDLSVDTNDASFKTLVWERQKTYSFGCETISASGSEYMPAIKAIGGLSISTDPAYAVNI